MVGSGPDPGLKIWQIVAGQDKVISCDIEEEVGE